MSALPQTTQRRLLKLPQIPSVWEGDRRSLAGLGPVRGSDDPESGECIIWVDGSEGFVRAMDVVPSEMGLEAMVRTLLRAIETPDGPAQPARPQKIVVRDRELQFFLRGALQSLEIAIDYVPELPLIDELFRRFEEVRSNAPEALSPAYDHLLRQGADELWQAAPWESIADRDIIAIALDRWGIETVYACVMGMLGREYGAIFYRSLESLKQFRAAVLSEDRERGLEQAFLSQDCWFVNYEPDRDNLLPDERGIVEPLDIDVAVRPLFGSIHPYEGMRSLRDEDEAKVIYVALQALVKFYQTFQRQLAQEFPEVLKKRFRIAVAPEGAESEMVAVEVTTMPQLTQELLAMGEEEEDDEDDLPIREDLVPENAILSLGMLPWKIVQQLQAQAGTYIGSTPGSQTWGRNEGDGLPIVLIQTTRPKAKTLIQRLQTEGGVQIICFNLGEDPMSNITYDLGLLQTGAGEIYLFGEFISDSPTHLKARQRWDERCQHTNGLCGLAIAMGATGASSGNPRQKDMLALFEAKAVAADALGLGPLQLSYVGFLEPD